MSWGQGFNRRSFIKGAGLTAVAGASGIAEAVNVDAALIPEPARGKYDFDEVYDRVGTDCYKWDKQINIFGGENIVVPMGIADMDFRTAPVVTNALLKRIGHENWGYIDVPPSYKESIISWNKRRYGVEIEPDQILNANGVNPAILSILRAFSPRGSKVIVQAPAYASFYYTIEDAGCVVAENHLRQVDGRYEMDFDHLESIIDHDTNALILCNPQNPTGNCWSREDLTTLGEICTRRRVVVIADEIHCDFVNKGQKYVPYETLDDEAVVRNSITTKSTSKSFNLAATKCAYMHSRNADYLARIKATGHNDAVNTLGIVASEAAYNEAEDWLDQLVPYIDGNMDFAEKYINEKIRHINWVKPEGTYLAWLDVSELAERIGAAEMAAEYNRNRGPDEIEKSPEHMVEKYLVENAGVQLNDGYRYGHGGAGHMRMNLATSRKLVAKALDNIASATRKA
ncbi:MAG: PatB family C-S lyase [Gammaproteobacteria bacterium]|nr:PatB family C-S lyase [Gammaproteobacteria bacterium]